MISERTAPADSASVPFRAKKRMSLAESISLSISMKMHQHEDDESLGDPGREVGETVAQLLDQECAVGVAQPVDRAGFRQERHARKAGRGSGR